MNKQEIKIRNLKELISNLDSKLEKLKVQKELYEITLKNYQKNQEKLETQDKNEER